MARSLKEKLGSMNATSGAARRIAPEVGLLERTHIEPISDALAAMDGQTLGRIGLKTPFSLDRAVFLDTETTGLGGVGTVAFLVGLGTVDSGQMAVRQYLMKSYADEPALLEAVAEALRGRDILVTFNGRSFDAPLLDGRYTMCRMENPLEGARHLDLLHPARRVWKLRLQKCNLGRLEEEILGTPREHDLPGSEVPERFFEYLKCGDLALLEDVIEHNRRDILSLGALLAKLHQTYAAPASQPDQLDLFSMGLAMERQGELQEARACYRLAAVPPSSLTAMTGRRYAGEANYHLSMLARREGDFLEAEGVWREMAARGQLGAKPHVELAKLYEHKRRDPRSALQHTKRALQLIEDEDERALLEHRARRLIAKIEKIKMGDI